VGHAAWWLLPLAQLIGAHVMGAPIIHTDDTPIKVLAPGSGQTQTGWIWIYPVDERPWQGSRAAAAYYQSSPDRKGERPRDHLATFHGVIQADAFSGYEALTRQVGPPGVNAPRGSDAGGERAAAIYTVLQTAKLNGLDPEAFLADTVDRLAKGHPINRLSELLPWNWKPYVQTTPISAAA
jgi:hypothetical protein